MNQDVPQPQQQQRRRKRPFTESTIRQRAVYLAKLLVVLRSGAHFYPTRRSRRERVLRWLFDTRFFETAREHTPRLEIPHLARTAVIDFCLGHVGATTVGEQLFEAFGNTDDGRKFKRRRELIDSLATAAIPATSTGSQNLSVTATNNVDKVGSFPSEGLQNYGLFWYTLYEQLRILTVTSKISVFGQRSVADDYDARIEFVRQVLIDTRHGLDNTGVTDTGGFVAYDECYSTLVSIGHLNKSMSATKLDTSKPSTSSATDTVFIAQYSVHVFGSNCIWMESDALYTIKSPNRRPPAFENEEQIILFGQHLMRIVGTEFVPDVLECRKLAVGKNRPVMTSVSRNEVSLQFSFAMPDSLLYTADLFYLSGGNTCTTDLRYRRECLSNACQCENRLSYWRLCVSIAAFDGTTLAPPDKQKGLTKFVTDVVRAFYLAKSAEEGAHFYINAFTGLPLIDYTNDLVALGGMLYDENISQSADSTTAVVCYIHTWLRGHMNEQYWRPVATGDVGPLLRNTPQLLLVYRPLISAIAVRGDGPNIFLKYKTFEDVIVKYVLLTLNALRNGYANKPKSVAYKATDCFWIFTDTDSVIKSRNVDNPDWLQAVESYGSQTDSRRIFDVPRDVDDIFRRVFSAPSRLYVHSNVLTEIGFNVTAVSVATPARTFTHTDCSASENRCTIFSSSPILIIDETTGYPMNSKYDVEVLRVLKISEKPTTNSPPIEDGTSSSYNKITISLEEFWPGVSAVKTTFKDPVLEHVEFVYFTAVDGDDSLRRLTANGLTRLKNKIMNDNKFEPISPPVLFALERIYARLEANKS